MIVWQMLEMLKTVFEMARMFHSDVLEGTDR